MTIAVINGQRIGKLEGTHTYLEGRRTVKKFGSAICSNVFLDEYLNGTKYLEGLSKGSHAQAEKDGVKAFLLQWYMHPLPGMGIQCLAMPAWAEELLGFPAVGEKFKPNIDLVDAETRWILPYSEIPDDVKERLGDINIGICIRSEEITLEQGKRIIHPALVTTVETSGEIKRLKITLEGRARDFARPEHGILRPIARNGKWHNSSGVVYDFSELVTCKFNPDTQMGINYVEPNSGNDVVLPLRRR